MKKIIYLFLCLSVLMVLPNVSLAYDHNKKIIKIEHNHSIDDIVTMHKTYMHTGLGYGGETRYEIEPSFESPYRAGSLNKNDVADAERALKMLRFLAGVPYEDVAFTDELNNIAQHGSVLLASSDQFSHDPEKPADMSDSFYELAFRGCSEANIHAGPGSISEAVVGWVYDRGTNNVSRVGHRRWIFNPGNQKFGIGYAKGPGNGNDRANMHVFEGMRYWECEADSYIAWPASGNFPIQYFREPYVINSPTDIKYRTDSPWSINLGVQYAEPTKDEIVLTLTRKRDGKVWMFDKNTDDVGNSSDDYFDKTKLHLSVDNSGRGMGKTIVFRPDMQTLGDILDGDIFHVHLSGIQNANGSPAVLDYDINFFDLDKYLNMDKILFTIGENEATVFGTKVINDVAPIIRNDRTMLPARFVAKNLGADVEWYADDKMVKITKENIEILIFIDSDSAIVNGEKVFLDSSAFVENDRTYTPVRFIAERLGAKVEWIEDENQIVLTVK